MADKQMAKHPVITVTEQSAAAIDGLDPDKKPYIIMCLLRPSAEAGPAGESEPAVEGSFG